MNRLFFTVGLAAWSLAATGPAVAAEPNPISAGAMLYVDVHRHPEYSTTAQVDPDGNINIPAVGAVNVLGLSEEEASAAVRQALSRYLKNPRVIVSRSVLATGLAARTTQMKTMAIALKNASAESVSDALQYMASEGGSVGCHKETNTVIITDTPAVIENMVSVINTLDEDATQRTQVLIETKIAEVQTGAMKELGLRWWAQGKEGVGGYYPMPPQSVNINMLHGDASPTRGESIGGTTGAFNTGVGRRFVGRGTFDRRLNVPVQAPSPGQFFFGLLNEHFDVGAFLDALIADNKAQILAQPMRLAVNHKPAKIESIEEFPYTEFGTEVSGRTNFSTKFLELGIKLAVTPHVLEDPGGPYIKLELEPEVSYATGASNGVPIRAVRRSEGETNVRNGQTLVIGGIYRNERSNFVQRAPIVSKVPILGIAFKHKEKVQTQTELVVFVTPTIHKSPEDITSDKTAWANRVAEQAAQQEPVSERPNKQPE